MKKENSGYYLTCNFHGQTLTLLRFGWIDADDWKPQTAPTGQMAGLSPAVYEGKLIDLPGTYRAKAPIELLAGVGPATAAELRHLGIVTIQDLLVQQTELPSNLARVVQRNAAFLGRCQALPEHSS